MTCPASPNGLRDQRGAALLLMLFVAVALGLAFFFRPDAGTEKLERSQRTQAAMAQAKAALIGFAISYRDTHPNEVFGFLPCPDTDNDGVSDTCGATDVSLVGRLPWKTLGLPPLRESDGECLWYAVSGVAKDSPKTSFFNWDTPGQFIVRDAGTNILAGATAHDRPLAIVFAAHSPLSGQNRTASGSECGGSNAVADYLEGIGPLGTATTDITIATADSVRAGTNNDQAIWISSKDIFDRVKARSDFKTDVDALLDDLELCLNALPPASLPTMSAVNKGVGDIGVTPNDVLSLCPPSSLLRQNFLKNMQDNLLYAKPGSVSTVNGVENCNAILIFGGERVTPGQSRSTPAERSNAANYLEAPIASLFPGQGSYSGNTNYFSTNPGADLVRCIKGLPAGATQVSFANDLASFSKTGAATTVTTATTDAMEESVTITGNGSGSPAGCFWSPIAIPLAGKTLRAYYDYQFSFADTAATRGYGFTFQLVRGDIPGALGAPSAPTTCGRTNNLGALPGDDAWGILSYVIETDVSQQLSLGDPAGNHVAIMTNGNLNHLGSGGTPTTACNGTTNGCLFTPASTFEESPSPLLHNQRIEIHTGCNSTCSQCNAGGSALYARISTWVDCVSCADVVTDLLDSELIAAPENRDFDAKGSWSGTNWSVGSNALNHTPGATPVTLPNSALTTPPVPGVSYKLVLTINTSTSGNLSIAFGGNSTGLLNQPAGTATLALQLDAVSTAPLTLFPDASWTGNISQASVRLVRTPIASRCVPLYPEMNSVFFGLTGGFLSGKNSRQAVTFKNLYLRSE